MQTFWYAGNADFGYAWIAGIGVCMECGNSGTRGMWELRYGWNADVRVYMHEWIASVGEHELRALKETVTLAV